MQVTQQLRTTNDMNGNPRRTWMVYEIGKELVSKKDGVAEYAFFRWAHVVAAYDEGYGGKPGGVHGLCELPCVTVSATDYRKALKQGRSAMKELAASPWQDIAVLP